MKADLCLKCLIGKPEDDEAKNESRQKKTCFFFLFFFLGGGGWGVVTKSDIKRDVQAEQMAGGWNFRFIVLSM